MNYNKLFVHSKKIIVSTLLACAIFGSFALNTEYTEAAELNGFSQEDISTVQESSSMMTANESLRKVIDREKEAVTYDEVPLYLQTDYPDAPYGEYGTVASHGCGITCVAMIVTYFTDTEYLPDTLAEQFKDYNTEHGSYWTLFDDSAEILGLPLIERTSDWNKILDALENQQVVALIVGNGIFTNGGHFIVLTGMTEDGKILVNDPYGPNYDRLADGFENGFDQQSVKECYLAGWIYDKKPEKVDSLDLFEDSIANNRTATNKFEEPAVQEELEIPATLKALEEFVKSYSGNK